jgi:hypothetical protein
MREDYLRCYGVLTCQSTMKPPGQAVRRKDDDPQRARAGINTRIPTESVLRLLSIAVNVNRRPDDYRGGHYQSRTAFVSSVPVPVPSAFGNKASGRGQERNDTAQ